MILAGEIEQAITAQAREMLKHPDIVARVLQQVDVEDDSNEIIRAVQDIEA